MLAAEAPVLDLFEFLPQRPLELEGTPEEAPPTEALDAPQPAGGWLLMGEEMLRMGTSSGLRAEPVPPALPSQGTTSAIRVPPGENAYDYLGKLFEELLHPPLKGVPVPPSQDEGERESYPPTEEGEVPRDHGLRSVLIDMLMDPEATID